jgi:hypothetical protein
LSKKKKKMKGMRGRFSSAAPHPHTCTHTHTHISVKHTQANYYFKPHPFNLEFSKLSQFKCIHMINMLNMELKHQPNTV